MKAVYFILIALLVTAECKSIRNKKRQEACGELEFLCANGRCIQQEWVCDTDNDCGDNSDEEGQYCLELSICIGPFQFHCRINGHCISIEFSCDGEADCPDGTDEQQCW